VLYSFSGYVSGSADGALPASGVIHGSDGNFYGTTTGGGTNSGGTVFRVTLSGAETVLYSFSNTSLASNDAEVNLFQPGLIQGRDGNFYGTTAFGGNAGTGTVYKLTNVIAAP
jgi:uncharacterized repeat protein (TIGR03803 family)